jgi:hypothetical protein
MRATTEFKTLPIETSMAARSWDNNALEAPIKHDVLAAASIWL